MPTTTTDWMIDALRARAIENNKTTIMTKLPTGDYLILVLANEPDYFQSLAFAGLNIGKDRDTQAHVDATADAMGLTPTTN